MEIQEIQEAIKENPSLIDGVVQLAIGTDAGKEILNNHAVSHFEANIGKKIGEIHSGYDNDIEAILGIKKEASQKSYDFVKQVATELKELKAKGGSDSDKAKIKELETKLAKDNGEHWHGLYKQGLETWESQKGEFQTKIKELNNTASNTAIEGQIKSGLSGIELNVNLPKEAQQSLIDIAVEKVKNNSRIVEGKLVIYKEGAVGEKVMISDTTFKPVDAKEALLQYLKPVLKDEAAKGGKADKGSGNSGKIFTEGEGKAQKKTIHMDSTKLKTREDFTKEFAKLTLDNGIPRGKKEWYDLEKQAYEKYGIAKLPRE